MQHLRPQQLAAWLADAAQPVPVLLDVRETWEVEICRIEGSLHLPMNAVPLHHGELPADQDIVVICHHGMRSQQVAHFLEHQGFSRVHNLTGGVEAWAADVDPTMRRY